MRKALVLVLLLTLTSCSSKPVTSDSLSDKDDHAAPTTSSPPDETQATPASQKESAATRGEQPVAEVILRDGTVMKAHPSMDENASLRACLVIQKLNDFSTTYGHWKRQTVGN